MHNEISRRRFLVGTAVTGAALAVPWFAGTRRALAFSQSQALEKWKTVLRGIGADGIPVAVSDGVSGVTGAIHYSMSMEQFTDELHPDLGGSTTLWGYKPANTLVAGQPQRHLGGIIIAEKGKPIQITFTNDLPEKHIIPVDTSSNFPDAAVHQNMTSTHVHGGFTPWFSDGIPTAWCTPGGDYGPSVPFEMYRVLNPGLQEGQQEHYYTNDQSARMTWYHDHAHDITRINVYAGLASGFIVRDDFERRLRDYHGLPGFIEDGGREIPIFIQDKIFISEDTFNPNSPSFDGTWPEGLPSTPGSLWYPHVYDPLRWPPPPDITAPDPSVIPEYFGDTMLVNGTVYPQVDVEARRYRLRVLNACNARFLNLQLFVAADTADGIILDPGTLEPTNDAGPDFLVVGTEGGFLPHPITVHSNIPLNIITDANGNIITPASEWGGSLVTAPAERWDVLVDFTGFAGQDIILYNDAPAPFPGGDPVNDYFPGATAAGNPVDTTPGYGPDSRQIMRFRVGAATTGSADQPLSIPFDLTAGNAALPVPLGETNLATIEALPGSPKIRRLTLNEINDSYGRLIQMLGTSDTPDGIPFMDLPATEVVTDGDSEVWQIINLTADTHPIHFHLVNVQIISRQPFDTTAPYTGGEPPLTGSPRPPDAWECGWKDTVRMNPGEVTNVLIPFTLPTVPFNIPNSPRLSAAGQEGHEYAWHCHILEHEEHDMMRPLVVEPKQA